MVTIIIILSVIVLVAYIKSLRSDLRAKQLSTARDSGGIAIVILFKFLKELIVMAVRTGQLGARSVEANHQEVVDNARDYIDTVIKDNGGTVKRAGVTLGNKLADVTFIVDANVALKLQLEELSAKVSKL